MKTSDLEIDDCWIDEKGIHWFCKMIQTTDDEDLALSYMGARMVKYLDKGMRLLTRDQFQQFHPTAHLYLRKGRHY
jgi:hypothetical protein